MRDRLIKLQCLAYDTYEGGKTSFEHTADVLLANGVVALPCKVGDLAYCIIKGKYHSQFMQGRVRQVVINEDLVSFYVSINGYFGQHYTYKDVGKNVFFTREEAERALKG